MLVAGPALLILSALLLAYRGGHAFEAGTAADAFLQRWKLPSRPEWDSVSIGPTAAVWTTVTVALGNSKGRQGILWYKSERKYINHAALPDLDWPVRVYATPRSDERAWELLQFYYGKDAKSKLKLISASEPEPYTDEWSSTQVVQVIFTTHDGSTLRCRFDDKTWQLRRLEMKLPLRSSGE